jgi:hypothetical protein
LGAIEINLHYLTGEEVFSIAQLGRASFIFWRILLDKLVVAWIVKKFHTFHGI